jgi:hypothetical protein
VDVMGSEAAMVADIGAYVPSTPVARAVDTRRECYNMGCAGALEGT